jgi:hypothetical protein
MIVVRAPLGTRTSSSSAAKSSCATSCRSTGRRWRPGAKVWAMKLYWKSFIALIRVP